MVKVDDYEVFEDLYYWPRGITWARLEPDGRVRVGFTDLASKLAGKILFVRVRPKGAVVEQGRGVATLETGKWVGPVESPVSGMVDEANPALRARPTLLNEDPYGRGWVALVKPSKPEEIEGLVHGAAVVEWYKREIEARVKKK